MIQVLSYSWCLAITTGERLVGSEFYCEQVQALSLFQRKLQASRGE